MHGSTAFPLSKFSFCPYPLIFSVPICLLGSHVLASKMFGTAFRVSFCDVVENLVESELKVLKIVLKLWFGGLIALTTTRAKTR